MQKLILIMFLLMTSHASNSFAAACTVSAPIPVNFGTYDVFALLPTASTGTIDVQCTGVAISLSYTVNLNPGLYGTLATRQMANGSNRLNYNLYIDLTHLLIWGDTTNGTLNATGLCLLTGTCNNSHTVYGQIPALQTNAGTGAYSDTITVTVTY